MDSINIVIENMKSYSEKPALFWNNREYSYNDVFKMMDDWNIELDKFDIKKGSICAVLGEFSPATASLFFALMLKKSIIVPFTYAMESEIVKFKEIAGVQFLFKFNKDDTYEFESYNNIRQNDLVDTFRQGDNPGLIVFSSGSTGVPKGILQDCERVMKKFTVIRKGWRMLLFLMMDHFGGFNTLLSTFAYGGTGVCLSDRSPKSVCDLIEKSKATLLPTTPTFINLLIASGAYKNRDLSSVELITYGTEMMPEPILRKAIEIFPNAQIKQTYGLSELGVLRSKSENDNSVWVKVGGDGFETKVVDDILWIRSEANMIGYLNAPNPFDDEGWMCTGDQVEVNGEYIKFCGRKSEIINVGGQKVFPVEVENVLLEDYNVKEASVFGAAHPLVGQVVQARISLVENEDIDQLSIRLRKACLEKLAKYKVPVKFIITTDEDEQHSKRFKKIRG